MKTYLMLLIMMLGISYLLQGGSEQGSENVTNVQSRIQAAAEMEKANKVETFEVAKGKSGRASQ